MKSPMLKLIAIALLMSAGAQAGQVTLGAPVLPSAAPDTYAAGGSATVTYAHVAPPSIAGSARDLEATVYWPEGADARHPRALVLFVGTNGWANSFHVIFSEQAGYAVGAGCVAAVIDTRVMSDNPWTSGDSMSQNVLRRTMRADVSDLEAALSYFHGEGRVTAEYAIEPRWTIVAGVSSGSITGLSYKQSYAASRALAGAITCSGAYGADGLTVSGETATTILRTQLGITEAGLTMPVCGFNWHPDTVLGVGNVTAYQSAAALIAGSDMNTTEQAGHGTWVDFPDEDLATAATMESAMVTFIAARCASTAASGGGVSLN